MDRLCRFQSLLKRLTLIVLPGIIFMWSLGSIGDWNNLLHSGGWTTLLEILRAFASPDLSPEIVRLAFAASWKTLAYATAGMTLAIVIAIILGTLASGVLSLKRFNRIFSITVFRGLLGLMRSIHELVWAWLFVAAVGLSPFSAILALAISYGGTLGRILADILNDVPEEPIKSLKSNGASQMQILFYGYFPMAIPNMISYAMYRFECALRSSTIMSFVGLGGLGYQIHLSLADLEYNEVWTFIFFLIALVVFVEVWSSSLRRRVMA